MTLRLFVFGLGYTARHLVAALRPDGWEVAGSTRGADACAGFAADGVAAHCFDGTAPMAAAGEALAGTTHLLVSVPPGAGGDPVLQHHAADIAACRSLRWIGWRRSVKRRWQFRCTHRTMRCATAWCR